MGASSGVAPRSKPLASTWAAAAAAAIAAAGPINTGRAMPAAAIAAAACSANRSQG